MKVLEPTTRDIALDALEALRRDVARLCRMSTIDTVRLSRLDLPLEAVSVLIGILEELAEGQTVAVQRVDDRELTTSEAADILGVSRPTLIDILERGEIPYRMAGTHRRVRQRDVFQYLARTERLAAVYEPRSDPEGHRAGRRSREERLRGLQEMAESTESLGLG